MVCDRNETDLNINIPAVMLPQDAGASLESTIKNGVAGELFVFFLPRAPRLFCRKNHFLQISVTSNLKYAILYFFNRYFATEAYCF